VKNFVSGIWTGIQGAFKSGINGLIDKENSFIGKINGLIQKYNDTVGQISGSTKITYRFGTIPPLATGGIVTAPTTALIGERGREAVLPLDRNTGWMDELASKISGRGGGQPIHLTVQVGDEKIAEHVIDYLNDKAFRSQSNLATL
jgi:hypothetical protein